MPPRFYEISQANHRILSPFTEAKLMLLGEICRLTPDMQQLDVCCGKAEMLCQWSYRWGIRGTGIDISKVFLEAARARASELGVDGRMTLIEGDAGLYEAEPGSYDVVSCIGATSVIGGGLSGTLYMLKPALKPGGLLLVGEPYWISPPTDAVAEATKINKDDFATLAGTLDIIEAGGMELVEMVLADTDSHDRYMAAQWMTVDTWLRDNPNHHDADAIRAWNAANKRTYLTCQRDYLGWGVFVLRAK